MTSSKETTSHMDLIERQPAKKQQETRTQPPAFDTFHARAGKEEHGSSQNHAEKATASGKQRFPFTAARAAVALAVAVAAVLGGVLHLGAGTPCAIGVEQIAAICPVGALEVMLGSKELMLHPIILLVVAVIIILIAGKAFCSWVCPVPWVRRLFRGKRASDNARRQPGITTSDDSREPGSDGYSQTPGDSNGSQALWGDDGSRAPARLLDATATDDSQARVGAPLVAPDKLQQIVTISDPVIIKLPDSPVALGETISPTDTAFSIAPELESTCSSNGPRTCGSCAGCEALKAVGGKRDGVQVDSRHVVLLGALGSAAVFGFPVLCLICPVGLTFAFLIGVANMFQFNEPSIALLIAPAILAVEVVFLRKWCTKFCPISALVSLISAGNKTFKPKVNESKCLRSQGIDCHACVEACPEQLDPHTKMTPECSKCGSCATACPAHAIAIKALSPR